MIFLYIGFNKTQRWRHLEVTLNTLDRIGHVYYYGHGFSTEEELSIGIDQWIRRNGLDVDFIVCDAGVFECQNLVRKHQPFKRVALHFPQDRYYETAAQYRKYFLSCNYKKLFIANWDYYNLTQDTIDPIKDNNVYVLGLDKSVSPYIDPTTVTYEITNCWHEFSEMHARLVMSGNFFIAGNEFNYTPLLGRPLDFDVPGTGYSERRKIMEILGLRKSCRYWRVKAVNFILDALIKQCKDKRNYISIYRSTYDTRIANSKMSFASGSELGVPVRKYLEIPAKGTLLVCTRFHGMHHLGFRHMENCIILERPQDILDYLNIDLAEAQRIARNGLELIKQKHSSSARAKQWKSSFDLIQIGEFQGSTWQNGEYTNIR